MKVIYSCYWGGYLAVVAASLHLGYLDSCKYSVNNILSLPMFNKIPDEDLGELFFLGTDNNNRKVYVIGSKKSGHLIEKTFKGIAEIYGLYNDSIVFVNLNNYYNVLLNLGIFLIKRLGIKNFGLKIIIREIEKNYDTLKKVVQSVENTPI